MNNEGEKSPHVHTSTGTLVSFLLMIFSWQLTIAMFAAQWLFDFAWLTPSRRWSALAVSTLLTVYYRFYGKHQIKIYHETKIGRQPYITYWHAILVVVLVVGFGAFGAWLF